MSWPDGVPWYPGMQPHEITLRLNGGDWQSARTFVVYIPSMRDWVASETDNAVWFTPYARQARAYLRYEDALRAARWVGPNSVIRVRPGKQACHT